MGKRYGEHGVVITPTQFNGWQDPKYVSKADYPPGTTQLDLPEGIYFTPQPHIEKDLVGFNMDGSTFLSGMGKLESPWGGRVTEKPGAHESGKYEVEIDEGCILDVNSTLMCWEGTSLKAQEGVSTYLWVDDRGVFSYGSALPSRVIPHTPLAHLSNNKIIDLRPHQYVGAHNDTPLQLIPTSVKTGNYTALPWELVPVDTSGGSLSVTLPLNPKHGDVVGIHDVGGALQGHPLAIGPSKIEINGVATPIHNMSGGPEDMLFDMPYTYIELVYNGDKGSWYFKEMPDGGCVPQPGSFIRCGGPHPGDLPVGSCTDPYVWDNMTSTCLLPETTGVYSTFANEEVFINGDRRCKCAAGSEEECIPEKGLFIQCQDSAAIYADGEGGIITVGSDKRCQGVSMGDFIRCDGTTAIVSDGAGGELSELNSPLCGGSGPAIAAKVDANFEEAQPRLNINASLGNVYKDESGSLSDDEIERILLIIEDSNYGWSGSIAANFHTARWMRAEVKCECDAEPCAVRASIRFVLFDGTTSINMGEIVATQFSKTGGGVNPWGGQSFIWMPIPIYKSGSTWIWNRIIATFSTRDKTDNTHAFRASVTFYNAYDFHTTGA